MQLTVRRRVERDSLLEYRFTYSDDQKNDCSHTYSYNFFISGYYDIGSKVLSDIKIQKDTAILEWPEISPAVFDFIKDSISKFHELYLNEV